MEARIKFKTFLYLGLLALLSALLFTSCSKSQKTEKEASALQNLNVEKISLDIEGMTCSGCEFNVESAIKKIAGVTRVEADFASHSAFVEYNPEQANIKNFIEAVNAIGYEGSKSNL